MMLQRGVDIEQLPFARLLNVAYAYLVEMIGSDKLDELLAPPETLETWGTSPEAQEGVERLMAMAGSPAPLRGAP